MGDPLGNEMIEAADQLYKMMIAYDPMIDGTRLHQAFVFGMEAHEGQIRASGEPYFTHPIAVANLLVDMNLDLDTVITALLHDTVEDCIERIPNRFDLVLPASQRARGI